MRNRNFYDRWNKRYKDWAGILPLPNQFERYDFQSVLWEEIQDDDEELEYMWGQIFLECNFDYDETDFDFIDEELVVEHLFWAYWWEFEYLLDIQFSKPGILMNGVTRPKRYSPEMLISFYHRLRPYQHATPTVFVEPMEVFSFSETGEKLNDEYLTKFWHATWGDSKVVLDNYLWLKPHWYRYEKYEWDTYVASRYDRRERAYKRLLEDHWTHEYEPLPEWMHRDPRLVKQLGFIYHNLWTKLMKTDRVSQRKLAWNTAYEKSDTYMKPRDNICEQEPFALTYRYLWGQKRQVLEKMIELSPALRGQRFNKLVQRDLYWNKRVKRFLVFPKIKTPRPKPIGPTKRIIYEFDKDGKYIEDPPEYVNVPHYAEEDDEEEKYNNLYHSNNDGLPPLKEEPAKTVQAISDDYFKNVKTETYDEIWTPDKNYDHFIDHLRFRTDCYDPHVPKPKHPHKYLVKGAVAKRIMEERKTKWWEAKLWDYEEKLKQGLKVRHPALPPLPPPPPKCYQFRPTIEHQGHIRRMRRGDRHVKLVKRWGQPETWPSTQWEEYYMEHWKEMADDNANSSAGRRKEQIRKLRLAEEKRRLKKLQDEWDRKNFPYYKYIADDTSVTHVIGIKSKACSYAAARMINGTLWLKNAKVRPCPVEENEFVGQFELDVESMNPLSEKARELLKMMKRQTAAADDILKQINTADGGKGWNLERKRRKSSNVSDVSELSQQSMKSDDYYPFKKQ